MKGMKLGRAFGALKLAMMAGGLFILLLRPRLL